MGRWASWSGHEGLASPISLSQHAPGCTQAWQGLLGAAGRSDCPTGWDERYLAEVAGLRVALPPERLAR